MMRTVTSPDGTTIAYDLTGSGPTVVLVGGAFSYRNYSKQVRIADQLARAGFSVINYDRRGRGDSSDTAPYAVQRELEDLGALIAANGGTAHVWGMSSGGVLAMRAAAAGLPITRLAVYQPPFVVDKSGPVPSRDFGERLHELLAADNRGPAVKHFMVNGMGAPSAAVALLRLTPIWRRLKAVAHTLPYDHAVMGETISGDPLATEPWARIGVPTLILAGAKAPTRAKHGALAIRDKIAGARLELLAGQGIDVAPSALVPELVAHFESPASPSQDNRPSPRAHDPRVIP